MNKKVSSTVNKKVSQVPNRGQVRNRGTRQVSSAILGVASLIQDLVALLFRLPNFPLTKRFLRYANNHALLLDTFRRFSNESCQLGNDV